MVAGFKFHKAEHDRSILSRASYRDVVGDEGDGISIREENVLYNHLATEGAGPFPLLIVAVPPAGAGPRHQFRPPDTVSRASGLMPP